MKIIDWSALLITAMVTAVTAQQKKNTGKPVRFLMGAALEWGGDRVAELSFTDGSTQTTHWLQTQR